jgi:sporulation-control protein spo0M
MSDIKLMQRIRDTAKALQNARDSGDQDAIDDLEDVLFELEEELEVQLQIDHEDSGHRGWN